MVRISDLQGAFDALCADCQKSVREALLYKLSTRRPNALRELERLRAETAAELGVGEDILTGRSRTPRAVGARAKFIARARREGFSLTEIAGVINRDHTTVHYFARRRR
jgi:chromosomal replication initiation ATPase DnaA